MRAALEPLRLRSFPALASAYFVNELGNWMGEIALAVLVFDATDSTLATAALFVAMQFVPALTAPALVARLDQAPPRLSLPALYAAEAALYLALAALAVADQLALAPVLALAAIDGSLASAARSLTRATATELLAPAGLLREGNALLNVGFTAGAAGGPALAGLVVAGGGASTALVADAVSFALVAALLALSSSLPRLSHERDRWLRKLRDGVRYVRERVVLRRLIAAEALAFLFFAVVLPIEVAFAKETLGAGDLGYGLLLASWGAGMVLGSFAFAWLRRRSLAGLLGISTLAIAAAYVVTGLAPSLAVACVAFVFGGAGNGVQWVAVVTAIQELTRASHQARVISLLDALTGAMPGVGFLLGGAIATVFSPRASFVIAGAGVLAILALAAAGLRGADWRRELEGPAEADAGPEDVAPVDPRRRGGRAADPLGP